MAPKQSGSKIVAIVVTATLTAVGVGCIYVPYFADRDKLRGMHEESEGGMSEHEKRQFEAYMQQIQERKQGNPAPMSNNMWGQLHKAANSADKKN